MAAPPPPTDPSLAERELLAPLAGTDATRSPSAWRRSSPAARLAAVPPTFFAIAFGLAGLAFTWRAAEPVLGTPAAIPDALFAASALVWAVLVAGLLLRLAHTPHAVADELRDPLLSPFLAVPAIVAMALAAGLHSHAPEPARVLFLAALVVVIALGGWLTGQWIIGPVDVQRLHPGYFLPTVAGGFLGANVAAMLGYRTLAWLCFGIGAVCWMQLGSVILNRLLVGPPLAAALVPTLAIEVAPPAVAGNAYFALQRGPDDVVMLGLAGFCVLAVVAQLRLVPTFARLPFAASFWAFAFSYTSVASFALAWLARERVGHERLLGWLVLGAITAFVAAVAVQSVRAVAAGRFFPATAPTP